KSTQRRDYRATHGEEDSQLFVKVGKKKKTTRWCKGKIGTPHETELISDLHYTGLPLYRKHPVPKIDRCRVCGKHVNYYFAPVEFGGLFHSQELPPEVYAAFEREWNEKTGGAPPLESQQRSRPD